MEPLPDVLDGLGLSITEVGGVQLAVESARLYWPSGELRVTLLLQAAWSGEVTTELALAAGEQRLERRVKLAHAEVRRVRLGLWLPKGAAPLSLSVQSRIESGAVRVRMPWIPGVVSADPLQSDSALGALFGALRQAVGKRLPPPDARAPEAAQLSVPLHAVGAEPPLVAEEQVVWQPGMADPSVVTGLRVSDLAAPPSLATRADGTGERPECPWCFARAYAEVVRAQQRCPSCDHDWHL